MFGPSVRYLTGRPVATRKWLDLKEVGSRILARAAAVTRLIEANNRTAALAANRILNPQQRRRLLQLIPQLIPPGRAGAADGGRAVSPAATPPAPDTLGG